MKNRTLRLGLVGGIGLVLGAFTPGCASQRKSAPTAEAEEVRDGEALPPAPPVPPQPAATESATAPTMPRGGAAVIPPPEPPPAQEALSEAQLAKVSELVNTAEVEQGKLAQAKAKAPAVKKFADMMVRQHGAALGEQAKIVKKLSLGSDDSAIAEKLKAEGETTLDTLKKTERAAFDAAYVKSQVEGHQKLLELLDTQLIPAAKTREVVDALRQARAIVEQHLSEARALPTK
jgi:putative membrane protein